MEDQTKQPQNPEQQDTEERLFIESFTKAYDVFDTRAQTGSMPSVLSQTLGGSASLSLTVRGFIDTLRSDFRNDQTDKSSETDAEAYAEAMTILNSADRIESRNALRGLETLMASPALQRFLGEKENSFLIDSLEDYLTDVLHESLAVMIGRQDPSTLAVKYSVKRFMYEVISKSLAKNEFGKCPTICWEVIQQFRNGMFPAETMEREVRLLRSAHVQVLERGWEKRFAEYAKLKGEGKI